MEPDGLARHPYRGGGRREVRSGRHPQNIRSVLGIYRGLRTGEDKRRQSEKFQPQKELASEWTVTMREMERETAHGWSSRIARTGWGREGSLRMYEGRLTRVRQQVWQESEEARDLGPGRQEKFSPQEVERMLADPLGQARGAVREQSPAASPLAAADN